MGTSPNDPGTLSGIRCRNPFSGRYARPLLDVVSYPHLAIVASRRSLYLEGRDEIA